MMDSQNISTSTFLPPPVDGEASAPLAQPDDDFVVSLSAAGTPNTPADDGGTGSTASPVSPVHLHSRQPHGAMTIVDDQAAANAGATNRDSVGLLPPPEEMDGEGKPDKDADEAAAKTTTGGGDGTANEDDDQVPVLAMSGILPATATAGAGATGDSKKNAAGNTDSMNGGGGGGTGNGENKSKDKSRYTSGSGAASGTEAEDSGTTNPPVPLGCGTMFEYLILITACSVLLLAVTGTTIYWVIVYQGGYDTSWIPWPLQKPDQWLHVGVFTYRHPQNFTNSGGDISTTTTTTTANPAEHQPNSSYPRVSIADQRFNVHPTMMTIGFITLTGFTILAYRIAAGFPTLCGVTYVKLIHGALHLFTAMYVLVGVVASMEYHRLKELPHLYSLHSWMGMLTILLFITQFILGFFTFVVLLCCRSATAACRLQCFAPIHATLGLCVFTMAVATCLTGIQQRVDFTIFNNKEQQPSPSSYSPDTLYHRAGQRQQELTDITANVIGVLLMATLVCVTVTLLSPKRAAACGRNPSSAATYCRNGGQTFHLVPTTTTVPAAPDGLAADDTRGSRNGRM